MEEHLSVKHIYTRLDELDGWEMYGHDTITKEFEFPSFREAIEFVHKVAEEAERMDHHPDITIKYKKVILQLTTHDAHGITVRDFKLAKAVEQMV